MKPDRRQDRDEWLMVQVAEGRTEMLELLVRRYSTLLLTFIVHMVGDRQRSEDIFQDVFLSVWNKRGQYRFPGTFKPWLYRIAVNRVREVFRRRSERAFLRLADGTGHFEPLSAVASPPDAAIATESCTIVQQAVATLPPRQRMVVTMRMWNGFSYGEIAQALGVHETTVRSNMHDALKTIRRYLEPRM